MLDAGKRPYHRPAGPLELLQAIERVRSSLEMGRGPAVEVDPPRPDAAAATDGAEVYRRLATGDIWVGNHRLIEEIPVPAGRRRFRVERLASPAGEPLCLEIIDPRLWTNPAVRPRFQMAARAVATAGQRGLWRCVAIDGEPSSGLHYLIRSSVTGQTLLRRAFGEGFASCQDFWNALHGLSAASRADPVSSPAITSVELVQPSAPPEPPGAADRANSLGMRFQRVPGTGWISASGRRA